MIALNLIRGARQRWLLLPLICGVLLLYAPALGFGFVYDDVKQVLGNPTIRTLDGLWAGFDRHFWSFDPTKQGGGGYYRPLFVAWMTAAYQAFGAHPLGYHVVSIVLHCCAALLVFALGAALRLSSAACLVGTAVFLLHPLQIQAVTWISAASDPLLAVLVLAAQLTWIRFLRGGRLRHALLAMALLAGALLILDRALLAPASLLLLSAQRRPLGLAPQDERTSAAGARARVREWLWHAVLLGLPLVALLLLRGLALRDGVSTPDGWLLDSVRSGPAAALRYVRNFAWPERLAIAYPERVRPTPSLVSWLAHATTLLGALALICAASYRRAPRAWLVASGLLSMTVSLSVGLLPAYAIVQDRYAYLTVAYAGLWLGDLWVEGWSRAGAAPRASRVSGIRFTAALALVGWATLVLGFHRSNLEPWRDNLNLYTRAVAVDPDNPQFLMNLANERTRRGLSDPGCGILRRVTARLQRDPREGDAVLAHFNLGNCLRAQGRRSEALTEYGRAQALAHGRMLAAGVNRVITHWELGDGVAAEREARELVRAHPQAGSAWQVLGVTLAHGGQLDESRRALERAVTLDPNDRAAARMLAQTAR